MTPAEQVPGQGYGFVKLKEAGLSVFQCKFSSTSCSRRR